MSLSPSRLFHICGEGGLRLSDPPSPMTTLLTRLEGHRCSAAPPSGSACGEEGWGHTYPLLLCLAPQPLPADHRDKGGGGVATLPPSLRGPLVQPTSGGNAEASPVAGAAGLSSVGLSRPSQPPAQWSCKQGNSRVAWAHAWGTGCYHGGRGTIITPSPPALRPPRDGDGGQPMSPTPAPPPLGAAPRPPVGGQCPPLWLMTPPAPPSAGGRCPQKYPPALGRRGGTRLYPPPTRVWPPGRPTSACDACSRCPCAPPCPAVRPGRSGEGGRGCLSPPRSFNILEPLSHGHFTMGLYEARWLWVMDWLRRLPPSPAHP